MRKNVKSIVYLFALTLVLFQACASKPKIAVDPSKDKRCSKVRERC